MNFPIQIKRLLVIAASLLVISILAFLSFKYFKKAPDDKVYYTILSNESNLKSATPERSVVILSINNYLGENQFANRVSIVGTQFNWKISIVFVDQFTPETLIQAIEEIKPDFVLSLFSNTHYISNFPNYLLLSKGNHLYLNSDNTLNLQECPHWEKADGFLVTFADYSFLQSFLEKNRTKPYFIQPFFHSCQSTPFIKNLYQRLFYSGFNWDKLRKSKVYQDTFKKLDQTGYLEVYGPYSRWKFINNSYRGFLRSNEALFHAMSNAGITLVLHSNDHLEGASLATRIFEAAATSTVAISDRHPLVQRYFGDSVLYIDYKAKSGDELFKQIDDHVRFIQNNPEIAEKLASESHQIFEDHFTLEAQLRKLEQLHEEHLQQLALYSSSTLSTAQ